MGPEFESRPNHLRKKLDTLSVVVVNFIFLFNANSYILKCNNYEKYCLCRLYEHLYACSPSSHSTEYSVSGVVSDSAANGKKIYILRYDDNQYIDSTVIEKNQFTFKGQVDTASYCRIDVDRGVYANFILENGDIRVDLQKHNQPSGTFVE